MRDIAPFKLKSFFNGPEAAEAEFNLSPSFAEPLPMSELLALEPEAEADFKAVSLNYPGLFGSEALREEIAERYEGIGPDQIQVSAGLDDTLALLVMALVEDGDRVVVQTPCYQPHLSTAAWRGAEVVPWAAREEQGWAPDLEELKELTAKPTRFVLVSFPNNPTGFEPDEAYLRELVAILEPRGIPLIADEIYFSLPQLAKQRPPIACLYEMAVSLHGLSKTLGLPGLRVGWLATRDREILADLSALRAYVSSYLNAPCDALACLALRHENEILARNTDILAQGKAEAAGFFGRHGNLFAWQAPSAGVSAFPRWLGPGGTKTLSERLAREAALLLAPSHCFDAGDDHVRVGLGCRNLPQALDRLDSFLGRAFRTA